MRKYHLIKITLKSSQSVRFLGINENKEMQILYGNKYKILLEGIKKGQISGEIITWIRRLKIVKMASCPN